MEVLFTVLLLIVPIFSVVSFLLSLIVYRRNVALRGLVIELAKMVRGNDVSPVDAALDDFRMKA